MAGGPGAIYLGDLSDLVGSTTDLDLGLGPEGMIPLDLLEESRWIYESDYYKYLIDRANFDNPTELVTQGKSIKIQYACINRALFPCKAKESFFVPNVAERTGGQLQIQTVGYPELGIAGPDTVALVGNGTLEFSEISGAYVGGALPVLDMYYFWGLFHDRETDFRAVTAVIHDLYGYIEDATGGGTVVSHNWFAGNDQWIEEGAWAELEELRMAPVWNATGLQKNLDEGMEHIPWDAEMREFILNDIVLGEMIPNWVNRVGGYDSDEVRLFNEKFGPIAGVLVQPDGTAVLRGTGKDATTQR